MTTEKLTTIARPYALAAFEYAQEKSELPAWESMLKMAAIIAQDTEMTLLLQRPGVSSKQLAELFCDLLSKEMSNERRNFIFLLSEYDRLTALPEIAELFIHYRAEHEKTMTVQVTSAVKLNEAYQEKLVQALTKRLKRKISLQCLIDETLLGGVVVRAGDWVLDGSIRGKLNRMSEFV